MEIVKIKNVKFGRKEIYRQVSGYVLKGEKGYLSFSNSRDKFKVLVPYMPKGGRSALQAILNCGGFDSLNGMEFILPLE